MAEGVNVVSIDTTAGFLDSGGFYQKAMITVGEIEPNGVWDMIEKVMRKSGGQKIRTLTIHGHGTPGGQGVAFSHNLDKTGMNYLYVNSFGELVGDGQYISCLGSYMANNSRIYLGGCSVAKGERGADLLMAVSQAVSRKGNTVYAFGSESWQNPWWPGFEGIDGGLVRYSDGLNVLYTQYHGMD